MKRLFVVFLLLSIAAVFPTHDSFADRAIDAQQRLESAKYREAQSRTLYDNFARKTGIKQLVDSDTLSTNPFAYKGTTVGVRLYFEKMVNESESYFQCNSRGFLISRTPSTKFTTRSAAFLAVKVLGTKDGKTHLQYIDGFLCRDSFCDEILYWTRASREKAEASRDLVQAKKDAQRMSKYEEQRKAEKIAREYFKKLGQDTLSEVIRTGGYLPRLHAHAHLVCVFENGQLSSATISEVYKNKAANVDLVLSALKSLLPRPFPNGMYDKYQVTITVVFFNVAGDKAPVYDRSGGAYDVKPLSDKLAVAGAATQEQERRLLKGQQALLPQLRELLEEQKRLAQQGDTEAKAKVKHLEERIKKIEGH